MMPKTHFNIIRQFKSRSAVCSFLVKLSSENDGIHICISHALHTRHRLSFLINDKGLSLTYDIRLYPYYVTRMLVIDAIENLKSSERFIVTSCSYAVTNSCCNTYTILAVIVLKPSSNGAVTLWHEFLACYLDHGRRFYKISRGLKFALEILRTHGLKTFKTQPTTSSRHQKTRGTDERTGTTMLARLCRPPTPRISSVGAELSTYNSTGPNSYQKCCSGKRYEC